MRNLSIMAICALVSMNLNASNLNQATQEHLSQYGITMNIAREFIMNNYQNNLELIFNTSKQFNVNNDMIAEILAEDFPGLKGQDVSNFFNNFGFEGSSLGFEGSVSHNGYSYEIVSSPITGRKWLDRNLGASEVCSQSRNDFVTDDEYINSQNNCLGDLYQWGRLTDGHEKSDSSTIDSRAIDISNAGINFILDTDWVESTSSNSNNVDDDGNLRIAQWNLSDGSSICPIGFRVPTIYEITNETINYNGITNEETGAVKVIDTNTAYKNFLKLPLTGWRYLIDGVVYDQGNFGMYWTRTTQNETTASSLTISDNNQRSGNYSRGTGAGVRCIDDNTAPTANAGNDITISRWDYVLLDAGESTDYYGGYITSYEWSENGTVLSNEISFTTSDFSVGVHNITLTIIDNEGAKASATKIITVTE